MQKRLTFLAVLSLGIAAFSFPASAQAPANSKPARPCRFSGGKYVPP